MADQVHDFLLTKLVEANLQIKDLERAVEGLPQEEEDPAPSLMQSAYDALQDVFAELGFDVVPQEQITLGLNFSSVVCELFIRERGHKNAESMLVYRGESWGDAVVQAQKLLEVKREELELAEAVEAEEESLGEREDAEMHVLCEIKELGPLTMRDVVDRMVQEYAFDRKVARDAVERLIEQGKLYLDLNMRVALPEKEEQPAEPSAPVLDYEQLLALHVQK